MDPVISMGWEPQHVDDTLLVKTGQCKMHAITVNGITAVGDVTVYDGVDATGTVIAVLTLRVAVTVSFQGITFLYDCKMYDGIYIDYDQNVGADLTVTYK